MSKLFMGNRSIFLSFCIFLLSVGVLQAGDWSSPQNLSESGGNSTLGALSNDLNGRSAVVFSKFNGSNYVIQAVSADPLGEWSNPVNLSQSSGDAFFAKVDTDSKGNCVAVWSKKVGDRRVIQASSKQLKKGWSLPVTISKQEGHFLDATHPEVVFDSEGNAYAVWQQLKDDKSVIVSSIKKKGRNDWSEPSVISTRGGKNGYDDISPKIAASSNGTIVAVWINNSNATVESSILQNGNNWQKPVVISGGGETVCTPKVGIDKRGNVTALWVRGNGQNLFIEAAVKNYANSWSSPVILSNPSQDSISPSLVVSNDGRVAAGWQKFDGAYYSIQVVTKGAGNNWSTPFDLTTSGSDAMDLSLALGPQNTAAAVWKGSDGVNFVVFGATFSPSGGWGDSVLLSESGQDAVSPIVSINPFGDIIAVWERSNGLNTLIQSSFKRS